MNKAWSTAVALAGLVSVFGCGSDEGTAQPGVGAAAGFGGGVAAGAGGGVATAGTGAAAPVACGTATCSAPALPPGLPIMLNPPCCANPATNTCGSLSGGMCMPPPAAAPNCPAPMLFGMTLRACCAAGNVCGIDASMLGMGCLNAAAIPGQGGGARPVTMCDGTVVQPPPTAAAGASGGVAGTGAGVAGAGTVGGAGGSTVAGGAGGASGGAGGATATSGAGGAGAATSGAGGARAGAGGAAAGTGAGGAGGRS